MPETEADNFIFSEEAIHNFVGLYRAMLKIRRRLLAEGYMIKNGKKVRRSGNFRKTCYNPTDYDNQTPTSK